MQSLKTKEEVIEMLISQSNQSRILAWELENFAQYEKARFEFDESGIVMLKGFNSAGKSNALRGLRYALTTEKVSNGKLKRYIRHGCLDASVTIYMSDGSEIKYIMQLSSSNPRARFVNGYHWYLNHKGKKYELFSTKVDGKYVPQKTTPGVLERYFNLTAVDNGYFNILKKADGMLLTEQSPKSINKALSKVTQAETLERAIKKVKDEQKSLLDGMKNEETLIGVLTEQIKGASIITRSLLNVIRKSDEELQGYEATVGVLTDIVDKLERVSKLEKPITLEKVDIGALTLLFDILERIERLSKVSKEVSLEIIPTDTLEVLTRILNSLETINTIQGSGIEIEKVEVERLEVLNNMSLLLQKQQQLQSTQVPEIENISTVALETMINLGDSLNKYKKTVLVESSNLKQLDNLRDEADIILQELKALGYPVIQCSHCGELAIAEEFEIGKGGVCTHVNS